MASRLRPAIETLEHALDTAWSAYRAADARDEEALRAVEAERRHIARQSAQLHAEHDRRRRDMRDRFKSYNADPSMDARHDLLRALGVEIPPPSGPLIDVTPELDESADESSRIDSSHLKTGA